MKKIQITEENVVRGFLGRKKTKKVTRTIKVDNKTYKKIMKERANRPFSLDEMYLYDVLEGED